MKVTIDEITDLLQIARYGLDDTRDTYFLCQGLYERIKKHGIAPPEGYCIVPINTLKHWLELVDLNPKDLAPRIDAYIKDSP